MGPRTQLVVSLFVTPLFCRSKCSRSPFEYNKPWTGGYANWSQSWLVGAFWEQPLVSIYLSMNERSKPRSSAIAELCNWFSRSHGISRQYSSAERLRTGFVGQSIWSSSQTETEEVLRWVGWSSSAALAVGLTNSPPQANINNSNNISGPSVSV